MNKYEALEQELYDNGVPVVPYDFTNTRFKGLYCDGIVAIDKDIETSAEKADVLAEELGHHFTTVGNIIDVSDARNRQQERKARLWAYDKQIGLIGLVNAFKHRCHGRVEVAEYLNVTEIFLEEALKCYRSKYGICAEVDNYVVFFEPALAVMEKYT